MKLALGIVQFGLAYGVANHAGKPPLTQAFAVLDAAWEDGVRLIDSAQEYGDANQVLAQYHAARSHRFSVINKVWRHPTNYNDVYDTLARERDSLRIDCFDTVMFHHPATVDQTVPDDLFDRLKSAGLIKRGGLSFERPADYQRLSQRFAFDVVQLPINMVNQQFISAEFIQSLARDQVEIHARSVFLQGLLLSSPDQIPAHLAPFKDIVARLKNDCADSDVDAPIDPLAACLLYVLQMPAVENIVVGAQDISQWAQISSTYQALTDRASSVALPWADYAVSDERLAFPALWSSLLTQA